MYYKVKSIYLFIFLLLGNTTLKVINMSSISIYLEENIDLIQSVFNKDDTLVLRKFQTQNNTKKQFALFFINGMVDISIINNNILMPIMYINEDTDDISTDFLQDQIIISSQIESSQDMEHIVDSLISGDVLLFVDGIPECLIIDCKGFNTRQIDEPEIEKSIKGPREGFNESLVTNLSLIRRKIKNKDLKFEYKKIGTTSHTKACICYIDGVADPKLIDEINKRIDGIKIDGVLDVKYIQELIDDTPFSIFETSGSTEKPDVLAAKLLEGRVGIFLDGTPSVMTAPFLFIENFQAPQDYYTNYYYASIIRILRIFASIITTGLPAIYLSLVTYHREVLPSSLLLSILSSRQGVPFPTVVELIGLLFIFEILIEAGSRMPNYIGQALSIVGALVLGSSAVEAKIVSAAMIIVVGVSSITGLIIPNLAGIFIILRTLFILFSSTYGMYGYVLGMAGLFIHLFSLESFGVPYMATVNSLYKWDLKDTLIRAPKWFIQKYKYGGRK